MMNKLIPIAAGVAAAFALALVSGGGVAAQNAPPSDLPPGPGHDEVAKTCATCHPAVQFTARKMSASEWSEILDRMTGLGAKVTEENREVILHYLSANFGTGETETEEHRAGG